MATTSSDEMCFHNLMCLSRSICGSSASMNAAVAVTNSSLERITASTSFTILSFKFAHHVWRSENFAVHSSSGSEL